MISIGAYTRFAGGTSGCLGKQRYDSYADAEQVFGRMLKNNARRPERGQMSPYFCGDCRGWHLGHSKRTGKGMK